MEHPDIEHGLTYLVIVLALHAIVRVGEFMWKLYEKKDERKDKDLTELSMALQQNSDATRELRVQVGILQVEISKIDHFTKDTESLILAVKYLAGPKWPKLRKHLDTAKLP